MCYVLHATVHFPPEPQGTSQSKDNWQFMILLFHLMSQRGEFQATAWPSISHAQTNTHLGMQKGTHAHTNHSSNIISLEPQINRRAHNICRWTLTHKWALWIIWVAISQELHDIIHSKQQILTFPIIIHRFNAL